MKGMSRDEAVRCLQDTLYVISGKWKILIISAMYDGYTRYRDIQRGVPGITTRVLSKELKALEQNKLVVRKVYDDSPVLVEYKPTEHCSTLKPLLEQMVIWGKNHRKKISEK